VLQEIYLTRFLFSFIGIEFPILWKVIGFLSITFIPGVLLLRILKVHYLSSTETILYSTGLSLTFVMIMGLFMNIFYPLIGIMKPFSEKSLLPTFIASIIFLCLLTNIIDKDFKSSERLFDLKLFFHPFTLFLLSIPLISILGTYLMNYYLNNVLQLLTLVLIGLTLLLFDKIPSKLYPFTIFIISISLLFHKSLISNYVHGWDIQFAYQFSEATLRNNYWDFSLDNAYNSLLAFPVLSTIYSKICDINIHWVYKIIYSFLFSLAPVGLFHIYKAAFDSFDDKKSLLSTFVFIFYYQFSDIVDKQKIAELFFILLLMLIIAEKINFTNKLLAVSFSFAIIQSHYGLSFILIFAFVFSYLILSLIKRDNENLKNLVINSTHILFFVVVSFSWYLYISSGHVFNSLVTTVLYTFNCVLDVFNRIEPRTGIYLLGKESHIIYRVNTILFIVLTLLIFVGVFQYIFNLFGVKNISKLSYKEYSFLPLFFILFLTSSVFVSGNLGIDRVYQISLLILAPFLMLGYQFVFGKFRQILNVSKESKAITSPNSLRLFSLYLLIIFMFNSGFAYYANNMHISANFNIDKHSEYAAYNDEEMSGALWLSTYYTFKNTTELENNTEGIYSDYLAVPLFYEFYDEKIIHDAGMYTIPKDQYYYKRTINKYKQNNLIDDKILYSISRSKNKIYNSNKVEIYKF
jgi:uncharacterized membrane protein